MQLDNPEETLRSILNATTDSVISFQARLLDAVEHAVIATDLDGIIIYWNKFAQKLYGWSAKEALGRNIIEVTPTDTSQAQALEIMSCLQRGESWSGEFMVRHRDGRVFPAMVTDSPIHDQEGRLIGIVGISFDITERKRAQEALRKLNEELGITVVERTIYLGSALEQLQQEIVRRKQVEEALQVTQERFQYVIASNPAIIYTCHPDGDYHATFVSETSKDILGYPTQEWLADPKFWVNRIHPEDASRIFANLSPLFEEGHHTHEYRFLHKDGTYRWLRDELKLVRDEAGNPLEIIGCIVDIGARKQIEQELQASQQKYKTLFEILPIGVSITDEAGSLIEANPASQKILGISNVVDKEDKRGIQTRRLGDKGDKKDKADQVVCTNATQYQREIIRPNGTPMLASEFACKRALKENKTIKNVEMGVVKSQQETTWLSVTAAPIPLKDYGVAIAYIDVTERKKVERIKDEFLAIASHELRTPLTSLQGSLGLLTTGRLGNLTEQGQQLLEFALLDTERLVRLVNDILDLKCLKFGKNVIIPSICQTDELIEQVRHVMQPIADDAGVRLSIASISSRIKVDRDHIIQVLTNLLSNAIKFSPSGSTVWLSAEPEEMMGRHGDTETRRQGDKETIPHSPFPIPHSQTTIPTILFQVKDQGRGIPSDQLETIFEPFRQVDVSDSRQKEGTGLGLAICRSIVQQHGGHIWVESTPGVGSTFYFTLAISPEKSEETRQ